MSSSASEGPGTKEIILKLMRPGFPESQDFRIVVDLSSTVRGLKNQTQQLISEHPDADSLRVIYNGRQLADTVILKEAFQTVLDSDNPRPIYLHVVIRPNPNPPGAVTTPARGFFTSRSSSSTASRSGTSSQSYAPSPTPTIPQGQTISSNTSGTHTPAPAAAPSTPGSTRVVTFNRQITFTATSATVFSATGHAQGPVLGNESGEPSGNRPPIMNRDGLNLASGSQFTPQAQTQSLRFRPQGQSGYSGAQPDHHQNVFSAANSFGWPEWATQGLPSGRNSRTLPNSHGMLGAGPESTPFQNPGAYPNTVTPQQQYYPIPQQQIYLAQGPDNQNNFLLLPPAPSAPPQNPWSFPPPRMRSPLAPLGSHMTPPPGLNLDENLYAGASPPSAVYNSWPENTTQGLPRFQAEASNLPIADELYNIERERNELVQRLEQDFRRELAALNPVPAGTPGVLVTMAHGPARPQTWTDYLINFIAWCTGGNPPIPNDRFVEIAAAWLIDNIWLALKLALGVYLLGGGRSTRRDMILWGAATIVFLAQSGILNFLFNHRLQGMADRLNALLPGLDVERFQQPAQANQQPQQQQPQQPQQGGVPHPQQLADRLIQQRNNRQNGGIWDNIQTSVGIFMASLVPGLGERVGNARRLQLEALEAIEGAQQAEQGHGEVVNAREGGEGDGGAGVGQAEQAGEGGQPNVPQQVQDQDVQPLFGL
ncbi:hypothetical protein TWF506_011014 [Arthrobotrys conoides]|uniref:Ubiquitin-like domain-containing protein n=1 Tax=Arthrobotrys conoides TaxID=74498 RepID=A0AAN8N9U2_9PEZI